jgi:hypothetical protein
MAGGTREEMIMTGGSAVRFRDERPGDLDRARAAVVVVLRVIDGEGNPRTQEYARPAGR